MTPETEPVTWLSETGVTHYCNAEVLACQTEPCELRPGGGFPRLATRTYRTAEEARDAAIDYSHHANEQDMSYDELIEWQTHWEQTLILFPELADEFRENGIC